MDVIRIARRYRVELIDYENIFEVVAVRSYDNAAIIAHSGWSCKKE
jgi:hypothetical protein